MKDNEIEYNYKNIIISGVLIGVIMICWSYFAYYYIENKDVDWDIGRLRCIDGRFVEINLTLPNQTGCAIDEIWDYGVYRDVRNIGEDSKLNIQINLSDYN